MEGVKFLESIDAIESIEPSQLPENRKNGETIDRSNPCENAPERAFNQNAPALIMQGRVKISDSAKHIEFTEPSESLKRQRMGKPLT